MSTGDFATTGPYPNRPSSRQIRQFREIIRSTGGPEPIMGILYALPPISPPPEVLLRFSVSEERRQSRRFVKCSICSPYKPKYADGILFWSPADGYLYIIGNDCHDSHFVNGEFGIALEKYRGRQELEAAQSFLFSYLPTWEERYACLKSIEQACHQYCNLRRQISRDTPNFFRVLRDSVKGRGGALVVEDVSADPTFSIRTSMGGRSNFSETIIHVLSGLRFIAPAYDAVGKFQEIIAAFSTLSRGLDQDDALLDELAVLENRKELVLTARKIRTAHARANRLFQALLEMAHFLSSENLFGIARWSADTRNRLKINVNFHPPFLEMREYGNVKKVILRMTDDLEVARIRKAQNKWDFLGAGMTPEE